MKNRIRLANNLNMPDNSATQKMAWLGTTGSGKTYGASKFAEQLWDIGAPFVVLDPVGVWYGIRLSKNGKKPSNIKIPIFGGLHGDVPLEPTGGELLANLVVDNNLSCIIDVSQFESDSEKARFATDFANKLFFRKKASPSALHLFLEECQEFVPQNPMKGEERMLHAFVRMQKLGRNFGIGSSYITQRPQEVNKKALNMAQTLFVFRCTGTQERAAIEKWIEDKSLDQSIAQDLPKLPTGKCHVWSPEFLKISELAHILEKETFNASATPEVGAKATNRQLAPIDLDKVRAEMSATIEKAKKEDPKELRKRIVELEKELNKKVGKFPAKIPVGQVLNNHNEIQKAVKKVEKKFSVREKELLRAISERDKRFLQIAKLAGMDEKSIEMLNKPMFTYESQGIMSHLRNGQKPTIVSAPKITKKNVDDLTESVLSANPNDFDLTTPEKRILNAIAWMESIGVNEPEQTAVAFIAGYTYGAGAFNNPRGSLRVKGLVEYRGSNIALTDQGRALAETPDEILSTEELHNRVLNKLETPQQRILKPLLEAYPEALSSEDLAEKAGYQHGSGAFNNPKGRLRSLGLIEYLGGGMIRARDILFIN